MGVTRRRPLSAGYGGDAPSRRSWKATPGSSAAANRTCQRVSVAGVAALANPGFLVEIEVVAVKDAK
jgi:hypothetical protein